MPESGLTIDVLWDKNPATVNARMAELVDALVSGTSDSNVVEVRVLFRAPFTPSMGDISLPFFNLYLLKP